MVVSSLYSADAGLLAFFRALLEPEMVCSVKLMEKMFFFMMFSFLPFGNCVGRNPNFDFVL